MLASQKTEFQEEVLMLLRNIVAKLRVLTEKIEKVDSAAKSLGMACGQAFLQVKGVVNKLADEQQETRMDLSEYGGTIEAATFFW